MIVCSRCQGKLSVHGSYERKIKNGENSEKGWIVQGHCHICNVYPSIIPEFIMPYKQYGSGVVERVIIAYESGTNIESLEGCPADISTMRRWIRQFDKRGTQAVGSLISILLKLYEEHVNIIELQGKTLLKKLERLLKEYPVLKNGSIIGRSNIVLTTQNSGFL